MIKSRFTLKQLEAFVFVADKGTFRKAADALGTTQPNVSVRLAALEQTLGTVLMHRDAGSVRLTERGVALLAVAREILHGAERFLDVAERRDLVEERLRLGVTELIAATWLHRFLRAFNQAYPGVRVELTVNLAVDVERDLMANQLDLAILSEPTETSLSGHISFGAYPFNWVATPSIADTLGPTPEMAALFTQSVLTHGRHTRSSTELRAFAQTHGLSKDRIVHSNSLAACLAMAADGLGVALLPCELSKAERQNGMLVPLQCDWTPDPLTFSALFDRDRTPLFVTKAALLAWNIANQDRQ